VSRFIQGTFDFIVVKETIEPCDPYKPHTIFTDSSSLVGSSG
jgi:hypothetical protein